MNFLITGHSRGLGKALTNHCLAQGHTVYGASRGAIENASPNLFQRPIDLSELAELPEALDRLVDDNVTLDVVMLNAGMLGPIASMPDVDINTFCAVMDLNVWANKVILDWLLRRRLAPQQILLISSGAGVRGNHGWSAYAISKAALNMLTQLYAHEMPRTQLIALAPGLVDTAMQGAIRQVDAEKFPSVKRLQDAHGTAAMPSAEEAADQLLEALPTLKHKDSGSFVDMRKL